jgi:uncharacterized protein (DUF885 family)
MTKNSHPITGRARAFLCGAALLALGPLAAFSAAAQDAPYSSAITQQAEGEDAKLLALLDREYARQMAEQGALPDGKGGFTPPKRLPHVDAASQQSRAAHQQETLAALNHINSAALSDDRRMDAAVLRAVLEADLANARFRSWEMPLNSDSNFWTYLDATSSLQSAEEYQDYLSRMADIPRYFDQHIANMRAGLARGFSVPQISMVGRDQSIANFVTKDAASNSFYAAFRTMPQGLNAAEQSALRAEAVRIIETAVIPAYLKLLDFCRHEYEPKTRRSISVQAMPQGAEFYAAQIKEYSTLDSDPDHIHRLGLSEVARIEAEMIAQMKVSGFQGSFAEFLHFLRTDPQFIAKSPDALMGVSAYAAKRVDGEITNVIGHLPRRRFTIRPVPDALAPFYTAGRGGLEACWMNTHNLASRPLYNIPALTLHECSPGHSLQAALAEEREAGHPLRRRTYFSGFGEGWGLYAEWLGVEMGIYRNPYEHFGRLSYEMWRAARLVIDTGIHQKGWSRDQAIAYLADHTALSRHEVETEVDRYISWPGQALAYKLGELKIRALRREAEQALGSRFDRRQFHDLILSLGSVPLPMLEWRVRQFIADGGIFTRD